MELTFEFLFLIVLNEMNGFYDPVWHCEGLAGSGNTWANEMNFWMKHASEQARSLDVLI